MENRTENQNEIFKLNGKYSIYQIDSFMAMSHCKEIQIKGFMENGDPIFSYRGKRKKFIMKMESKAYVSAPVKQLESGVFEGWDQKIYCDTDSRNEGKISESGMSCRQMRGNACYNFIGSVDQVRSWIEEGQINQYFNRSKVVAIGSDNIEKVVFSDEYQGGHAIIDRILANA